MFFVLYGAAQRNVRKIVFSFVLFCQATEEISVKSASAIEKCRLRCWVGFSNHCSCGQAVWNIELARTYTNTRCVCGGVKCTRGQETAVCCFLASAMRAI